MNNTSEWVGGLDTKPDWDTYFMTLAFVVAQRSIDPNTVHGSVLVAKNNTILSLGYNGPIRGSRDADVPLSRPSKYDYIIHSEINCLLSFNGSKQDLEGAKIYITGMPCCQCLSFILQKDIHEIIYGVVSSKCIDKTDEKVRASMLENREVIFRSFEDVDSIQNILFRTSRYIDYKAQ